MSVYQVLSLRHQTSSVPARFIKNVCEFCQPIRKSLCLINFRTFVTGHGIRKLLALIFEIVLYVQNDEEQIWRPNQRSEYRTGFANSGRSVVSAENQTAQELPKHIGARWPEKVNRPARNKYNYILLCTQLTSDRFESKNLLVLPQFIVNQINSKLFLRIRAICVRSVT